MENIAIITRKTTYDTGVIVSIRHLEQVLRDNEIEVQVYQYSDDEELVNLVRELPEKYINIHVPAFSDQAMEQIMNTGKHILLSIHSTLCNLQAEEGMLERIFAMGKRYENRLIISCPSQREVTAMNAFRSGRFVCLPNTFHYEILSKREAEEKAAKRLELNQNKLGYFCAYRPLKNLPIQVAAACLCKEKYDPELHFFQGDPNHPLFRAVKNLTERAGVKAVFREALPNAEFYESIDDVSVLLQVSLSETLSYVALEHMIRGIPVIGSSSIPFATLEADYSDVEDIAWKLDRILRPENYLSFVRETRRKAMEVVADNNVLALNVIRKFVRGEL